LLGHIRNKFLFLSLGNWQVHTRREVPFGQLPVELSFTSYLPMDLRFSVIDAYYFYNYSIILDFLLFLLLNCYSMWIVKTHLKRVG